MNKEPDRRFYLREFKAISHAISTYEDLNTLIRHLAEGTARAFKAHGCSIMLLDERENQLFHMSSNGGRSCRECIGNAHSARTSPIIFPSPIIFHFIKLSRVFCDSSNLSFSLSHATLTSSYS